MSTFRKLSVVALALLLLMAPLVGTAQVPTSSSEGAATSEPTAKTAPEKGMVWVNTESGVYHREGDRWYGKTKDGKFMTEADAKEAGYREVKR